MCWEESGLSTVSETILNSHYPLLVYKRWIVNWRTLFKDLKPHLIGSQQVCRLPAHDIWHQKLEDRWWKVLGIDGGLDIDVPLLSAWSLLQSSNVGLSLGFHSCPGGGSHWRRTCSDKGTDSIMCGPGIHQLDQKSGPDPSSGFLTVFTDFIPQGTRGHTKSKSAWWVI